MKIKRMTGFVVLAAGVVLFIFALYEQHRVGNAKESISRGTSMFSGNAVGNAAGGFLEGQAGKYDTTLRICEIGGIILIIAGGGILYFGRKKR
jgi:hypothetical protein